jgi:hypothetical protein
LNNIMELKYNDSVPLSDDEHHQAVQANNDPRDGAMSFYTVSPLKNEQGTGIARMFSAAVAESIACIAGAFEEMPAPAGLRADIQASLYSFAKAIVAHAKGQEE